MKSLINYPWIRFGKQVYLQTFETEVLSRAAQAAFYFSFAFFPAIFFVVSVFGLVLGSAEALKGELYDYLRQIVPGSAFDLVSKTVDEIVVNSSGSKLALGLGIALWSASAGVDAIRSALNAVYDLRERRPYWVTKPTSLLITLVVVLLVSVVLGIVFYGWQMIQVGTHKMGMEVTSPAMLVMIQWTSILVVMLLACEIVYNFLPDFRRFKWDWITPGSLVAMILWLLFSSAFRVYLSFFNSYNKAYGSLGAVMILLLWFYLTALVVMIGGVINSVVYSIASAEGEDPAFLEEHGIQKS